jgi:hypothetical protein
MWLNSRSRDGRFECQSDTPTGQAKEVCGCPRWLLETLHTISPLELIFTIRCHPVFNLYTEVVKDKMV